MKILSKRPNIILAVSAAAALLLALIVGWSSLPLGLTGEWTWQRRDVSLDAVLIPFLFELPVFLIAFGAAYYLAGRKNGERFGWLILLAGLHFAPAVWDAGFGGRGENVTGFLDTYTGGYLSEAAKIDNPGAFFAGYAHKMSLDAEPSNHLDVHPPGNVFFSYQLLQFCRKVPASADLAAWCLSAHDRAVIDELKQNKVFIDLPDDPHVYNAAILLLALSNLLLTAANVLIILSVLVLRKFRQNGIVYGILLAAFLPGAPVLFAGHFDVFMYFFGALGALFIALALQKQRLVYAVGAGLALAIATTCTLAFGALILLTGPALIWKKKFTALAVFGGTGLLFVAALWLLFDVNMVECCLYASRNNAAFFRESGRSILAWWPYNTLDLVLFAGPLPVLLMLMQLRRPKLHMPSRRIFSMLTIPILLLLLISPFSRGEMGRLLIAVMPLVMVTAIITLSSPGWRSCSKLLLGTAILTHIFLIFVIRVTLKLVIIQL